jgi:hypothetical protein
VAAVEGVARRGRLAGKTRVAAAEAPVRITVRLQPCRGRANHPRPGARSNKMGIQDAEILASQILDGEEAGNKNPFTGAGDRWRPA